MIVLGYSERFGLGPILSLKRAQTTLKRPQKVWRKSNKWTHLLSKTIIKHKVSLFLPDKSQGPKLIYAPTQIEQFLPNGSIRNRFKPWLSDTKTDKKVCASWLQVSWLSAFQSAKWWISYYSQLGERDEQRNPHNFFSSLVKASFIRTCSEYFSFSI